MFTSHRTDENEDGTVSRYGVGVVLRSEEIREALMTQELKQERAEEDAAHAAAKEAEDPGYTPASASAGNEFERFEDLTRKLVNIPKDELDEKRKEES